MVARHFVERRLVHVRQIERLMARLAVEEMDVFDLSEFSRLVEPCHGAVMPVEADLLPHRELASLFSRQRDQFLRLGQVVGDRLGDEHVQAAP